MKNETLKQYLDYIKSVLSSLPQGPAYNAYSTGYGLNITTSDLGEAVHALDLLGETVAKIRTPQMDGEQWYAAWDLGIKMVNEKFHTK